MRDQQRGGGVKINTDDNSPMWLVGAGTLLAMLILAGVITAILGWSGSLSLHWRPSPAELAEGAVIQQMAPKATEQALRLQQQNATLALAEDLMTLNTKVQLKEVIALAFGAGILAGAGYLVVVLTLEAGRAVRASRLPATKRVHRDLVIIETHYGPMLLDLQSGRSALLRDASGVNRLKIERPEGAGFEALTEEGSGQLYQELTSLDKEGNYEHRNAVVR